MALHSVVAPKIDIVNKDSPIVSLTLINQKTITLTTNHTQAAILFDHYEPRAQSIHFQEYSLGRKTGD